MRHAKGGRCTAASDTNDDNEKKRKKKNGRRREKGRLKSPIGGAERICLEP
jgi:hypothetical protein